MRAGRRGSGVRTIVLGLAAAVLIFMVGAAEWLLRHPAGTIAVAIGVPAITFALGRWSRTGRPTRLRRLLDDHDQAELARLRDDNTKLRAKVRSLSDMLNGGPR